MVTNWVDLSFLNFGQEIFKMKKQLLKKIFEKKEKKIEFAIITNLENGESCIFEKDKPIDKNFEKHKEKINFQFD